MARHREREGKGGGGWSKVRLSILEQSGWFSVQCREARNQKKRKGTWSTWQGKQARYGGKVMDVEEVATGKVRHCVSQGKAGKNKAR